MQAWSREPQVLLHRAAQDIHKTVLLALRQSYLSDGRSPTSTRMDCSARACQRLRPSAKETCTAQAGFVDGATTSTYTITRER